MLIIFALFAVFMVFYGASLHAMHQEQQIRSEAKSVLMKAGAFSR